MAYRFKILSAVTLRLIRQDMEKKYREECIGISPLSFGVMHVLMHEPLTLAELGRRMIIAPASLVPVVDALCTKGLLRRGIDKDDRRRNPLFVMPKGKRLLSRYPMVSGQDALLEAFTRLGAGKTRQLLALSEELVTLLADDASLCKSISEVAEREASSFTIKSTR